MNNRTIQLNLSKFRAINEANIDLNGISVVSGINGSGKSTLLNCIGALDTPTSGSIFIILKQKFIKTMKVIWLELKLDWII